MSTASGVSKRAIEAGVIGYLRSLDTDAKPHTGDMRRAIGCTNAELMAVIATMRNRGKIAFDRLALSPSLARPVGFDAMPAAVMAKPPAGATELLSAPAQLLRDVEAYCRHTNTREIKIGAMLFNHPGYIGMVRKRGTASPATIAAVRELMAAHPHGLGDVVAPQPDRTLPAVRPRPSVAEAVAAEAEARGASRAAARSTGSVCNAGAVQPEATRAWVLPSDKRALIPPLSPLEAGSLTLVERVQGALVETPDDLIRTVGRRHAALWAGCVRLGRAAGRRPGEVLFAALEIGLAVVAEDLDDVFSEERAVG